MSQLRSTMEEHHQEAGKESKVKEGNKTSSYSTSPSRERDLSKGMRRFLKAPA